MIKNQSVSRRIDQQMFNPISMNVKIRIKNNKDKLKVKNSIKTQYINIIHTCNKIYMYICMKFVRIRILFLLFLLFLFLYLKALMEH